MLSQGVGVSYLYGRVLTGGTFDRFHEGHRHILRKAFEVGFFVTIGVSSDEVVRDKYLGSMIESFGVRVGVLSGWLDMEYGSDRYEIVRNEGVYPREIFVPDLEANVMVDKTGHHGENVNRLRLREGLSPLAFVFVAPLDVLSSSDRRKAEVLACGGQVPDEGGESLVDVYRVD